MKRPKQPDPKDELAAQLVTTLRNLWPIQGESVCMTILTDMALGRRGWYSDLIECYIPEEQIRDHGRIAAMRAAPKLGVELNEECYR